MKHKKALSALLGTLVLLTTGCNSNPAVIGLQDTADGPTPTSQSAQQTITIIGASTPYPALELLADAYTKKAVGVEVIFLDSSQSGGGIEAVKEGFAEIGTVTRSPKPAEADSQLTYQPIAKDGLLVGTHPSVTGVDNLTTQNLQDVYSGKVTNWKDLGGPDADIVVLDRAEDTSAKRLLRKYYLGDELENAPNAIMLNRESGIIDALQTTPHSIGTLSLAKATTQSLPINHISLNGVTPTADSIDSGNYEMHRTLGIVWYKAPSETTQGFIDFIFSEAGSSALEAAGFAAMAKADS
ncbi:MAG: substrate-binding domain-containing protein [Cyanobacteria bacterium J06621_3]